MTKPRITFIPIDGSGVLHIDFEKGPLSEASEATKGDGVGFFSANGILQGVTFDDVDETHDDQTLVFGTCAVAIAVRKGKVSFKLDTGSNEKKSARTSKNKSA
jgi:hypothetical protein